MNNNKRKEIITPAATDRYCIVLSFQTSSPPIIMWRGISTEDAGIEMVDEISNSFPDNTISLFREWSTPCNPIYSVQPHNQNRRDALVVAPK